MTLVYKMYPDHNHEAASVDGWTEAPLTLSTQPHPQLMPMALPYACGNLAVNNMLWSPYRVCNKWHW